MRVRNSGAASVCDLGSGLSWGCSQHVQSCAPLKQGQRRANVSGLVGSASLCPSSSSSLSFYVSFFFTSFEESETALGLSASWQQGTAGICPMHCSLLTLNLRAWWGLQDPFPAVVHSHDCREEALVPHCVDFSTRLIKCPHDMTRDTVKRISHSSS